MLIGPPERLPLDLESQMGIRRASTNFAGAI
jgi:hypothetical protein